MMSRVDPRNHILDGGTDPLWEGAILREKDMAGHARQHSAVICATMTEPIDLLFGLWTRVG